MSSGEAAAPKSEPAHPDLNGQQEKSKSKSKSKSWGDLQMEVVLGNLLRAGVMLAAAVVFSGACLYIARHAHERADYHVFRVEPAEFRTISGVIQSVKNGRGRGLIQLGLLLLIATPIARVAFSIIGFTIERDRMYVAFTVIVLAILLYSLLGSGIGI